MADGSPREHSVVIIGGGVAGLAAAAQLGDRDVLVLDEAERLGGRLHSIAQPDGSWINLGAHLLTGGESRIAELVRTSGLDTMPVPGLKSALWFGDRLYRSRRVESYPFVLPLTVRERWALVRVGLRIRLLAERWRRAARRAPAESWPDHRRRFAAFESSRTFAALLDGVPERVASIFRTAARRSAGEADELTAGAALSIFGALWVGAASASVTNVRGGSGLLGEHWRQRLGDRVIVGAEVRDVREGGDHVTVDYVVAGDRRTVHARHVIVATPAPVAATIVSTAPADVRDRLAGVTYGPFVCVGLLTDDIGAVPWDDVYAISTPGLSFDMLFHHSSSVRDASGRAPGRKSLMCYAGGDHGRALADRPDEDVRQAFVADVERVLPQLRGAARDVVITRWERGNCYATPGVDLAPVIAWSGRDGARVHLAGDYFGALGGTADAAAASGYAAATAAGVAEDQVRTAEPVGRHDG